MVAFLFKIKLGMKCPGMMFSGGETYQDEVSRDEVSGDEMSRDEVSGDEM